MPHPPLPCPAFDLAFDADLSQRQAYNRASAVGSAPVLLTATAPPWSYLVEFPAPLEGGDGALYLAELSGAALEGSVSLATVRSDGKTLCDDRRVTAGEQGTWQLAAGRRGDCRGVLVRAVDARPIAFRIDSLKWHLLSGGCEQFFAAPPRAELTAVPEWNRYYGMNGSAIERLRGSCYEVLDAPRAMPWLFGLQVVIQPAEQISRAVFVSGLYEPATMIAMRRLVPDGACVIDGGANIGLMTLASAAWAGPAGRILSFEPSSREHARLAEHVALNRLSTVEVRREALGASEGVKALSVAESQYSGLNTLAGRFAYDGIAVERTEPVHVTTIDAIAAEQGLTRLDVVKLDVEGAEVDVLLGGLGTIRRLRPVLVFEAFESALTAHGRTMHDLSDVIRAVEYETFAIQEDGGLRPVSEPGPGWENFVAKPRS